MAHTGAGGPWLTCWICAASSDKNREIDMGCPTIAEISDTSTLTFSITTHDPDTGVLTDADAAPAYRIYEDETATAIATGEMAKLDDDNTTGFYTEMITTSSANGYEHGKTYTIYITATVDSDTGGITYGFKAFSPLLTVPKAVGLLVGLK